MGSISQLYAMAKTTDKEPENHSRLQTALNGAGAVEKDAGSPHTKDSRRHRGKLLMSCRKK